MFKKIATQSLILVIASFVFCTIAFSQEAGKVQKKEATPLPNVPSTEATPVTGDVPSIEFKELTYDFGEIEEGQEVTHIYKFNNTGKGSLKVDSVRTSCGCTAALVTAETVAPGAEGDIKVTFKTAGKKGDQAKRITVRSNDPKNPIVTLTIKGKVKVELDVTPDTIFFGQIKKNQGLQREIKIMPSNQKDFKIESIKSSSEFITTTMDKYKEAEMTGYKVMVNLSEKMKPGSVSESITINTNNTKKPQIKISISGRILGDIVVTPTSLSFVSSAMDVKNIRRLVVVNDGPTPMKIEKVIIDKPEFSYEIKEVTEGKQIEIEVTFKPTTKTDPRISTPLKIITNNPDQKEIDIPMYASLRQAEMIPAGVQGEETQETKKPGSE
jgi:hypothetical protein